MRSSAQNRSCIATSLREAPARKSRKSLINSAESGAAVFSVRAEPGRASEETEVGLGVASNQPGVKSRRKRADLRLVKARLRVGSDAFSPRAKSTLAFIINPHNVGFLTLRSHRIELDRAGLTVARDSDQARANDLPLFLERHFEGSTVHLFVGARIEG